MGAGTSLRVRSSVLILGMMKSRWGICREKDVLWQKGSLKQRWEKRDGPGECRASELGAHSGPGQGMQRGARAHSGVSTDKTSGWTGCEGFGEREEQG